MGLEHKNGSPIYKEDKTKLKTIDPGLCSLDILGAKKMVPYYSGHDPPQVLGYVKASDVASENCCLRQNQTEFLGRGNLTYIASLRNETLKNRGYNTPEDWEFSWHTHQKNIWTPEDLNSTQLTCTETWIQPEYFKANSGAPTKIIEATNRATGTVVGGFEQTQSGRAPVLTRSVLKWNGHQAMECSTSNIFMRGDASTMWNVADEDFLIVIALNTNEGPEEAEDLSVILSKKNSSSGGGFSLHADHTGTGKKLTMYLDGTAYTRAGATFNPKWPVIVLAGRQSGEPVLWMSSLDWDDGAHGGFSEDLTDLDVNHKPWLASMSGALSGIDQWEGGITELIFINNNKAPIASFPIPVSVQAQLTGYLAWKYKNDSPHGNTVLLPDDHPYYDKPPRESTMTGRRSFPITP